MYYIKISENALIQMCLSTLEAYSVIHETREKNTRMVETYGQVYGHEIKLPDDNTLYQVEMFSVDTSAIRRSDSCTIKEDALTLKRDFLSSFFPHLDILGDFHSHPYKLGTEIKNYKVIESEKRYEFSDADHDFIKCKDYNYRVGLVMTITSMGKAGTKNPTWVNDTTITFKLGNYRLWLKGYVAQKDERNHFEVVSDDKVLLDCPSLVGLIGEYTPFGRLKSGKFLKHVHGAI